jgi:hypothetical protein
MGNEQFGLTIQSISTIRVSAPRASPSGSVTSTNMRDMSLRHLYAFTFFVRVYILQAFQNR